MITVTGQVLENGASTTLGTFLYGPGTANPDLDAIVATLDAFPNVTAILVEGTDGTQDPINLFPVKDHEIKGVTDAGGGLLMLGTDVRVVTFNSQGPALFKLALEGRGSDRVQVSLREV
jgi:hypothetical protein